MERKKLSSLLDKDIYLRKSRDKLFVNVYSRGTHTWIAQIRIDEIYDTHNNNCINDLTEDH